MRDMTARQFQDALARNGMRPQGFMGYVDVGIPGHSLHVSALNGGSKRRNQLAYLLAKRDREMQECSCCGHMRIDHAGLMRVSGELRWKGNCNKCACQRMQP